MTTPPLRRRRVAELIARRQSALNRRLDASPTPADRLMAGVDTVRGLLRHIPADLAAAITEEFVTLARCAISRMAHDEHIDPSEEDTA